MTEQSTSLSAHHRRFLVVEQAIVPGVINLVAAVGISLFVFRALDQLPLWGGTASVGVDLLITAVAMPALTCWINSVLITRDVRCGKVPPLAPEHFPPASWYRASLLMRVGAVTVAVVVLAALPVVAVLEVTNTTTMSVHTYVSFKGIWATVVALIAAPIVAWLALARASEDIPPHPTSRDATAPIADPTTSYP